MRGRCTPAGVLSLLLATALPLVPLTAAAGPAPAAATCTAAEPAPASSSASAPATDAVVVSTHLVGSVQPYTVVAGDTLNGIGARFGVAAATLASQNGLTLDARLRPGQSLTVDNRHLIAPVDAALVINIPQRLLVLRTAEGPRAWPLGLGKPSWPTPLGPFTVIEKETDPTWDVPESIQAEMRREGKPVLQHVPPGPDNPLGAYFVRLSFTSVGIHGTNAPASVYRFQSHGCIRMQPAHIAEFFPRVAVGDAGVSVYAPLLMGEIGGRVFLEAHPDIYRRLLPTLDRARQLAEAGGWAPRVDWTRAAAVIQARAGVAVDVTADR